MGRIRSDLDLSKLSSRKGEDEESCDFDYEYTKFLNAGAFRKNYSSCGFVLNNNKKLFLLLVIGLVISYAVIINFFFFLNTPAIHYQTRISVLRNLYDSKVILLKSLAEI